MNLILAILGIAIFSFPDSGAGQIVCRRYVCTPGIMAKCVVPQTCAYGTVKEVCGCCDTCAKGRGESCGQSGTCAANLQCCLTSTGSVFSQGTCYGSSVPCPLNTDAK